jgi:hypothetical protein
MGSNAATTDFNFGLTKIFLFMLKTKNDGNQGSNAKKNFFLCSSQVPYPDGFAWCKKREQKILTLGHLEQLLKTT